MDAEQLTWVNGASLTGSDDLQARCRRQEAVIDRLSDAVAALHHGATTLKEQNAELRSETSRLRNYRRFPAHAARPMEEWELVEVSLPLDDQAPGSARSVVTRCLDERVEPSALASAQLLVTELVSNSLRHSGFGDGDGDVVVVSVELTLESFRVGVLDPGSDAAIAVRPADMESGGGFGLNLVRMLSERWGVEYLGSGGTQVWAQLRRESTGEPA
jgi:anti-sigma regulatory factor (Ser/Thr protein kinase)